MSKFVNTLTASDKTIKKTRATNLELTVKMEAEDLVRRLTREKLSLIAKIDNLTDLGPDSTFSLRPGGKDFDASKWVSELHETTLDLDLKDVELEAAEAILSEWFSKVVDEDDAPKSKAKGAK